MRTFGTTHEWLWKWKTTSADTQEHHLLRAKTIIEQIETTRRTCNALLFCFFFRRKKKIDQNQKGNPDKWQLIMCGSSWCLPCYADRVFRVCDGRRVVMDSSCHPISFNGFWLNAVGSTEVLVWSHRSTLYAMEGRMCFTRTLHLLTKLWWLRANQYDHIMLNIWPPNRPKSPWLLPVGPCWTRD